MYLGRYPAGATVHLYLFTDSGSGDMAVPDAVPSVDIYSADGKIFSGFMPVEAKFRQDGVFHFPVFMSNLYGVGRFEAVMRYEISGNAKQKIVSWDRVAGGSADGAVTSMFFFRRPFADFVLRGLENGTIKRGRNPVV